VAYPQDQHQTGGREAGGILWFTVAQAAAFTGVDRQTVYGWERRGLLTGPSRDEHGRRIYSQQQIAEAYKQARDNAQAARRAA
jgi:predicted site-specific integrase-resolvase